MNASLQLIDRLERARREMVRLEVDVVLLSVGRDLPYLIGYEAMPLERLTMAVIPASGTVTLVVPELEVSRVDPYPEVFDIRAWSETEDPLEIVMQRIGFPSRVAIGTETWSLFLLGLQQRLPESEFISAAPLLSGLRVCKSPEEIDLLRTAGAAADRVVARIAGLKFSGKTEKDMARQISELIIEEGHDATSFVIVAAGVNSSSPHHEPGVSVIEPGDAVVVDFGGSICGYHSDTTRTFYVGGPSAEHRRVHETVLEAQHAGYNASGLGVRSEEVDRAARSVIADAGYAEYFIHRTGHGIGLDLHEDPYLVEGEETLLRAGMVFSIEPGIYIPGRFGVRIEDIVSLGENGLQRLNRSTRDPVAVT